MRNIIRFILKNHFVFLFILLQFIAAFLIVNFNSFHRSVVLSAADNITNGVYNRVEKMTWYLNLREENTALIKENNALRNYVENKQLETPTHIMEIADTMQNMHFLYTSAAVINNSTNKQHNYLILNKGEKDGIKINSFVISPNGVVGKVLDVTTNFSKVMSLLNLKMSLSAKIKKNGYYGNLYWDGNKIDRVILDGILYHVPVSVGDTIVTSGFSEFFPEGVLIGTIYDFKLKGNNFYEIQVELSNDFRAINNVYVVENLMKDELELLENNLRDQVDD